MNKVQKITVLAGLFVGTISSLSAQIGHGGLPYSFRKSTGLSQLNVEWLPYLDNKTLLEEETTTASKQDGFTFGKEIDVNYNLDNSGLWENLSNGSRLWRLAIESTGAYSLNLLFDSFYIPPHSHLFIYTEDQSFVMGSFTYENNNQWGDFATSLLPGDAIVLEYYESEQDYGKGIIQLSTVVHGYKNLLFQKGGTWGSSMKCNVDANCEDGNQYPDAKRATAMILLKGSALCSGTLLNNTAQDGKPYFLTANHCLFGNTSQWVFVFNYESIDCNNDAEKLTYSINGATLLANHKHSDFALLLLNAKPTKNFNAYYAGWDSRNIAVAGAFGFHHPNGDKKKFSKNKKLLDSSKYDEDASSPDNTHWKVTYWDMGVTEGGSSGSALFNNLQQVIGQLEGGPTANCSNPTGNYDLYGKFAYSWTNGNNPNKVRLDYWLDSLKTGVQVMQGYDPYKSKSTSVPNGVEEDMIKISLLPNPAVDRVVVTANTLIISCKIYSVSGQCVKSETINSSSIDLNVKELAEGVYILELQTEQGILHKKLGIRR